MLDLRGSVSLFLDSHVEHVFVSTLVTVVPARKKTVSSAKQTLHGCRAWTTAVNAATTIPEGVSDFLEYAR